MSDYDPSNTDRSYPKLPKLIISTACTPMVLEAYSQDFRESVTRNGPTFGLRALYQLHGSEATKGA